MEAFADILDFLAGTPALVGPILTGTIIFLTSKVEYGGSGADLPSEPYKYIAKPFKDRDLQLAIEMALYHHHLKRELREGEEKYRLLADSLAQPFFELDEVGVIVYANDVFCRLLDYSRQLVQGLSAVEITDKAGAKLLTKMVSGNSTNAQNQFHAIPRLIRDS